MSRPQTCGSQSSGQRPRLEVAEIFRAHGETHRQEHRLSQAQHKAMWSIERCRTAALGGHLDICACCGYEQPAYNSCCNRNCPKCQALAQARWLEARSERILPVGYFHVVFTLPADLRLLVRFNPATLLGLLCRSAAHTLLALGRDSKRLGAELGVTTVLHTWTRDLRYHPHVHCVVTSGGLSPDASRWVSADRRYLFPVQVMGALCRGKFMAELRTLHERGELRLPDDLQSQRAFDALRSSLYRKKWIVYSKRPFGGAEGLYRYLGQYTHRVAISNHRIRSIEGDQVTIGTRHGQTATMSAHTFIHRFLQHVLPHRFVKIRHYGLFASSNVKTKLATAQQLLTEASPSPKTPARSPTQPTAQPPTWQELFKQWTGTDLSICPACGSPALQRVPLGTHETSQLARPPPTSPVRPKILPSATAGLE